MPIRDIQERFRELGRIRMGVFEAPASGGKPRPRKLARFRLTSKWRHLLDEAATVYGGRVAEWEHPQDGKQFELLVEADSLDVVVPPGEVLSQWYELWAGGGCRRRCDGVTQVLVDKECQCPATITDRQELAKKGEACSPTSRLAVMLPAISDLGVWRLESHGYNAAFELGGAAALCELATRQGVLIPGRLALEARSVKRPDPKDPTKSLTRRFAVPVLGFRGNLGETLNALGFTRPDGLPVVPGSVERRPALDAGGSEELPATDVPFGPKAALEAAQTPTAGVPDPEPYVPPAPAGDPENGGATMDWAQMFAMRARDVDATKTEVGRHGLLIALTQGRTQSGKELDGVERSVAMAALVKLARGMAELTTPEPGFWVYEDKDAGTSTSGSLAGAGPSAAPSTASPTDGGAGEVIDVSSSEPSTPAQAPAPSSSVDSEEEASPDGWPTSADEWRRFLGTKRLKIGDAIKVAAQCRPDAKPGELPGNLEQLANNGELSRAVYERLAQ